MDLNVGKTRQSGGDIVTFRDHYDEPGSIQKSSLVGPDAIWIGKGNARLLLTQEQVSTLLPILEKFVDDGEIV